VVSEVGLPGVKDASHKRSTDRPGKLATKIVGKPDCRLNAYLPPPDPKPAKPKGAPKAKAASRP
jgi:hypothetical protein